MTLDDGGGGTGERAPLGCAFVLNEGLIAAVMTADPAGVGFCVKEVKVGDEEGKGWDLSSKFGTDCVSRDSLTHIDNVKRKEGSEKFWDVNVQVVLVDVILCKSGNNLSTTFMMDTRVPTLMSTVYTYVARTVASSKSTRNLGLVKKATEPCRPLVKNCNSDFRFILRFLD